MRCRVVPDQAVGRSEGDGAAELLRWDLGQRGRVDGSAALQVREAGVVGERGVSAGGGSVGVDDHGAVVLWCCGGPVGVKCVVRGGWRLEAYTVVDASWVVVVRVVVGKKLVETETSVTTTAEVKVTVTHEIAVLASEVAWVVDVDVDVVREIVEVYVLEAVCDGKQ